MYKDTALFICCIMSYLPWKHDFGFEIILDGLLLQNIETDLPENPFAVALFITIFQARHWTIHHSTK